MFYIAQWFFCKLRILSTNPLHLRWRGQPKNNFPAEEQCRNQHLHTFTHLTKVLWCKTKVHLVPLWSKVHLRLYEASLAMVKPIQNSRCPPALSELGLAIISVFKESTKQQSQVLKTSLHVKLEQYFIFRAINSF